VAYFLKKSLLKKGLYLQIYESFYDPLKKQTAHRSHQAIGYADALGIADPIAHYQGVVAEMNEALRADKRKERERQITQSPEKHIGYFLIKAVFDGLGVARFLDFLQLQRDFRFHIADVAAALVYSCNYRVCVFTIIARVNKS